MDDVNVDGEDADADADGEDVEGEESESESESESGGGRDVWARTVVSDGSCGCEVAPEPVAGRCPVPGRTKADVAPEVDGRCC